MTRKGWLLFLAMSVIWGIPYFFINIAVREVDPSFVVFARAAIAAAILIPLVVQGKMVRVLLPHWPILILFALIHMVGAFLLISYGEQHVASSLTSLLIAANPLLVAVYALLFDKSERMSGVRLVGLVLGLLGLGVLLGFDVGQDRQLWLGAAFIILAALGYATGAVLLKQRPLVALPRIAVAAVECTVTTIVLIPLVALHFPTTIPSNGVIASLIILGVICTALALPIFFALIAEVGASRGTVITYINPVVSTILGVAILHEAFTFATLVGFLLIISGSWISTTGAFPFRGVRGDGNTKGTKRHEGHEALID